DHWFATEILPHEAALTRYLKRVWFNAAEIPDLRQEVYVRIYEGASKARPLAPKAFLFTTARNLMADRARRERVVSIDYTQDPRCLDALVDEISPEQRMSARQELRRLASAFDQLTDDCRNVIWLRRVEGMSQRDAAARLAMREGTLESHLCRGLRVLMSAVFGHEQAADSGASRDSESEREHG
ncbi:RNA polymerase sigma factor, partial [Steroidobacter sp.]|uniref:RNA polymerase sigma factor n=1 Tax=Steroidobacter sp. TaxID=1978227 RepID=UPI001A44CC8E